VWLLLDNFQKGSGDISENDGKVENSRMQIRFIASSYPTPFNFLKRVVCSFLEHFSQVVETLLKGFHAVATTDLTIH
jgi:hypothetical protein